MIQGLVDRVRAVRVPDRQRVGRGSAGPGGIGFDGAVPVARRLLLGNRSRLATSVAGVGLALMLILLLDGISAGVDARVTVFEQRAGADLYVAQPGTSSLLGSTSLLPASTAAEVAALPAVTWTATLRGFFTVQRYHGRSVPAYVVGFSSAEHGGPWALASGRAPVADDEIAVGGQFAAAARVGVGDPVTVLGHPFTVVGIADDADMFMASFVFVTHHATDTLLRSPTTTSFVLVGSDRPAEALEQIRDLGLTVRTRDELARADLALKGQAYSAVLALLVGVAFAVGTVVIAITVYATVMEHRRDYGVMKAVGADGPWLTRVVMGQSLALAGAGLAAGAALFVAGARLLGVVRPQFAIVATGGTVARVVVAALVMGALAAYLPARRLVAMEPALAFRGA